MVDVFTAPFLNQLNHYLASGFDIQRGDFVASEDIFNLSFERQDSVPWPVLSEEQSFEKMMLVPDQFSCDTAPDTLAVEETSFMHTQEDFSNSFGLDIAVKGSTKFVGMRFRVAAKSSLMFTGSLFKDEESTYALNYYIASILKMNRQILSTEDLTEAFISDAKSLPNSAEVNKDQEKYLNFLKKYGTHYLDSASFGGVVYMQTSITKSLFEKTKTKDISAGLSASFKAGMSSGSASISTSVTSSEFFSQNSESFSSSLSVKGGLFVADGSAGDWYHSLYDAPTVLLTVPGSSQSRSTFVPISTLLELVAPAKASVMLVMIDLYEAQGTPVDDLPNTLFLSPTTINENIVYESKEFGAGLLVVTASGLHEVSVLANYTTRLETTYRPTGTNGFPEASVLTAPVLPTGNFLIQRSLGSEASTGKLYRFNPNLAQFGYLTPAKTLSGGSISFGWDGFMIIQVSTGAVSNVAISDGSRTFAGINTIANGIPPALATKINSLMVPVRKNHPYRLTLTGTSTMTYRFLSFLSDSMAFESSLVSLDQDIDSDFTAVFATGVIYQAPTDGFLLVHFLATTATSGDIGLSVYSDNARDNVVNNDPSALLGNITRNGITTNIFPVTVNAFFKVNFDTVGAGSVVITFIPIVTVSPQKVLSGTEYSTSTLGEGFLIKSSFSDENATDTTLAVNGSVVGAIKGAYGSFIYPIGPKSSFTMTSVDASLPGKTEAKLKQFGSGVINLGTPSIAQALGSGATAITPESDGMLVISLIGAGSSNIIDINVTTKNSGQVAALNTGTVATKKMASIPVQKGVEYTFTVINSQPSATGASYQIIPWTSPDDRFVLAAPASFTNAGLFQSAVNGFLTITAQSSTETALFALCHEDEEYVVRRFVEATHGGSLLVNSRQGTVATATIPVVKGEYCQVVQSFNSGEVPVNVQFHSLMDTFVLSALIINPSVDESTTGTKAGIISGAVVGFAFVAMAATLLIRRRYQHSKKKDGAVGEDHMEIETQTRGIDPPRLPHREVPDIISLPQISL